MAAADSGTEIDERQARTPLGRTLQEIRRVIVTSGTPLLSWEELERELNDRRGERATSGPA